MRPSFACLLAAAVFAFGASAAPAATLIYTISAPCLALCESLGLETGDRVEGRFTVDRAAFAPGGEITPADLIDFSVRLGAATVSSANAAGASLSGAWGARPNDVSFVGLIAATAIFPGAGPGFSLETDGGFASLAAACDTPACSGGSFPPSSAQLGGATVALVPAPPALLLAVSGAAALMAAGGRRARRRSA